MKNAWDQFSLITIGAVVLTYGLGVYLELSLDQILIRCLVVGAGLALVFTVIHIWLSSVFGDRPPARDKKDRRLATAGGAIIDRTIGGREANTGHSVSADGGSDTAPAVDK